MVVIGHGPQSQRKRDPPIGAADPRRWVPVFGMQTWVIGTRAGTGGCIEAFSVGPDHDRCHPWLMTSGDRAWGRLAGDWCQAEGLHCFGATAPGGRQAGSDERGARPVPAPADEASDADRDAVVAALSEHFQTGRLTREELDERTGRALTARTLEELDELTADLPAIRPAGPAPVVRRRGLGYPLLALVAAALAALAIAALALGVSGGRQEWDWWWVIPVGLLLARGLAGRGGVHRDSGRNWPQSETGHGHRSCVSAGTVHCPGTGHTGSGGLVGS